MKTLYLIFFGVISARQGKDKTERETKSKKDSDLSDIKWNEEVRGDIFQILKECRGREKYIKKGVEKRKLYFQVTYPEEAIDLNWL